MSVAWLLVVASCLPPPVSIPPDVPFRPSACEYCPGHRGLGYSPSPGTAVSAIQAGEVAFAGQVGGVNWVVVLHDDRLRTSYGYLSTVLVRSGQRVAQGQTLGLSGERLHLGVRDGDGYVDPTNLLGQWVGRPRLVPTDGTGARVARPPVLACPIRRAPSPGGPLRE